MDQHLETACERETSGLTRRTMLGASTAALAALPSLGGLLGARTASAQTAEPGITARGWGMTETGGQLHPVEFSHRAMRDDDIVIEIMFSGICHSDVHAGNFNLGAGSLLVPGHEIVGRVSQVGRSVSIFKVGDIAGVGAMVNSCGTCANCTRGLEQYCFNGTTWTYGPGWNGNGALYGGYSNRIVVRERFAIQIPAGMDLPSAAPLLCAGITTFSPIQHWDVQAGMKTGVVGLGGLGHMALKFLKDRGTDVTVFTTTPAKQPDAVRMGASETVVWSAPENLRRLSGQFDFLLVTLPYTYNVDLFSSLLRFDGTLVNLGVLGRVEGLNGGSLILGRRTIAGSNIGGISETQHMMNYCVAADIRPEIEVIPINQVNNAWQRMINKDVRYRFVIDMSTLA